VLGLAESECDHCPDADKRVGHEEEGVAYGGISSHSIDVESPARMPMIPIVTPRFQKQAAMMSRPPCRSLARDNRAINQKATANATLVLQP